MSRKNLLASPGLDIPDPNSSIHGAAADSSVGQLRDMEDLVCVPFEDTDSFAAACVEDA